MIHSVTNLERKAAKAEKTTKLLFRKLSKNPPDDLDYVIQMIHKETFSKTVCLLCANCCGNLGPRLIDKDIDRLSKFMRIKPSSFTAKYLRMDEEGIMYSMKCPARFF